MRLRVRLRRPDTLEGWIEWVGGVEGLIRSGADVVDPVGGQGPRIDPEVRLADKRPQCCVGGSDSVAGNGLLGRTCGCGLGPGVWGDCVGLRGRTLAPWAGTEVARKARPCRRGPNWDRLCGPCEPRGWVGPDMGLWVWLCDPGLYQRLGPSGLQLGEAGARGV